MVQLKVLEEIGDAYTSGDASKILKVFGDSGITSVYNIDSVQLICGNKCKSL
jgi:sulfide:quinone oxidoreductase